MYLEPAELQPFLVLAEELHFRKASERLFLSQPALSKHIRKLEKKVGGPLFIRSRRKVALTEAARVLIPLAQKLLQASKGAFESAREAAEGRAGTLRIGFGIASVSEILPRTIIQFRRAYPRVELQMQDMSTPAQITGLLNGTLDIGMVRMPLSHPQLSNFPLFRERLVAATPRGVSFRAGLAGLRDRPFIFYPRAVSETFHGHVLAVCRHAGFTPRIVQEASELFTILNLVRAGLGVALVPSSAVRMHVPGVHLHELRIPEAEWKIGLAWSKLSEKRELISRFSAIISDTVRKL
ncbi:MAG TPA: LysR family transcriptional regulator [Candidatus Eremiobacteraceae bacterium]|nr:LysR family transcriptional regulator [Candidatus Eremiobacteraceae bacterium]